MQIGGCRVRSGADLGGRIAECLKQWGRGGGKMPLLAAALPTASRLVKGNQEGDRAERQRSWLRGRVPRGPVRAFRPGARRMWPHRKLGKGK